jgi:uncharacterized membrane protein
MENQESRIMKAIEMLNGFVSWFLFLPSVFILALLFLIVYMLAPARRENSEIEKEQ